MLVLDDDIADYLKERGRLDNKPFERVVNETLRRGMEVGDAGEPGAEGADDGEPEPFRVVPNHSSFAPGVDPLRLKDILAEMDMEDYYRKERNFRKYLDDRSRGKASE